MKEVRLAIINCVHHEGACDAGHFGGRPSPATCEIVCKQRQPLDPDAPAVTYQVGVSVCRDRLKEEWSPEWRERLLAAATASTAGRIVVPVALYEQAMKNRR